jgi:tetratricopeptide (TPR) repeat protein
MYLDGQMAYRRGRYNDAVRAFRRALDRDPSFAMAGLGLAAAAGRIDATEDRSRGLSAAWASRADLTARDTVNHHAHVGPRYPETSSPREYLTAWERAAAVLGDRADVWQELGERIFYDGRAFGMPDWTSRARAAFRRAAALDATFASPIPYLIQLAAADSDTASVRAEAGRYAELDSTDGGELGAFVRWRAAVALDDATALARLRRTMSSMPIASLRSIALASQHGAVNLSDAARVIAALTGRAARGAERADALLARHALALNRGAARDALRVTETLADDRSRVGLAARLRVTDYLYADGDSSAAASAAELLRQRVVTAAANLATTPAPADASSNECIVGQWRAWLSTPAVVDSASLDIVPGTPSTDSLPDDICSAVVRAIEGASAHTPDAAQRAARADSLAVFGTPDDELKNYVSLALARVWLSLGDNRRALDAVRRRPYMRRWPHYLAAHLAMEGKIAQSLGDSTAAVIAYTRYVNLRDDPDAQLRGELATARAAIAELSVRADSTPSGVGK